MRFSRRLSRWSLHALGFLAAGQAALAHACPVCFSAKDDAQRQAFFDTTVFLTLLPVAMIGGIAYWIAKRSAHIAAEVAAEERAQAADSEPEAPAAMAPVKAAAGAGR
jgi:hypothetical protein